MRSVRARLSLAFATAALFVLVAYSGGVYFHVRGGLFAGVDRGLADEFDPSDVRSSEDSGSGLAFTEDDLEEEEEDEYRNVWLEVRQPGGALVLRHPFARTSEVPLGPAEIAAAEERRVFGPASIVLPDGTHARLVSFPFEKRGASYRARIARSEEAVRRKLASLLGVMALELPLGVALAALAGYFLARRALSPVDRIVERAQSISAERLGERLPVENPNDELGRLAAAFNDAFARLETAFEKLRRFTADAAHELRTPLAALKAVGEVSLRGEAEGSGYRDTIGSMLEEVDRLARLVDRLLALSRADSGETPLAREATDVAELVRETIARRAALAEEKRQSIRVDAPSGTSASLDRELIRQALSNVLDNAIRHTPEGGEIRVGVSASSGEVRIDVEDQGPGIAPEHREKVFERFYRIDAARSREHGGAGLGLAIARSFVAAHGGRIEIAGGDRGGAVVRLFLPAGVARRRE